MSETEFLTVTRVGNWIYSWDGTTGIWQWQPEPTETEKVRDKVSSLVERGDVEKVSSRAMRLPLQVNPGGKGRKF